MDGEERAALRTAVREYVDREVMPRAAEMDERSAFPRTFIQQLAGMGATSLTVPTQFGGLAADTQTYVEIVEELARGWIALAGTYSVHMMVTDLLLRFGSPAQVATYLPRLIGGEIGAVAMTEAEAGSDLSAISARAVDHPDGYRLEGSKNFITSGGEAGIYIGLFRHGSGTSLFLVDKGAAGLSFGKPMKKMGYAGSPTTSVVFDGVVVSSDGLLGDAGRGLASMYSALDYGRIGIAAMAVGLAQSSMDFAIRYAATRKQFGQAILDFQALQFMAADMRTAIEAARQLVRHAAATRDQGGPYTLEASMAKLFATDTTMRVTTDAVQILGGYGYTREYPVERYMREAKMLQIVEGTNQIQRIVIARQIRDGSFPNPDRAFDRAPFGG